MSGLFISWLRSSLQCMEASAGSRDVILFLSEETTVRGEKKGFSLQSTFTSRCTYWCVRARRLSRLVYPAAVRVSLYLSNPTDCSHAHTDHSGTHTSGTTDTHTSEPTPDSSMVPVGLWKQRQSQQPGCWWQRTKLGVWNHNWRSRMHGSLVIKVKHWRCGCEYSMNTCLAVLCMSSFVLTVIWKHLCLH